MNKQILITVLVFFMILNLYSSDYTMSVILKNGTTSSFEIADVSKITFKDVCTNINDVRKYANVLKTFRLLQNFPNPFNPKTTIEYDLPRAGKIEIKIFNVSGQLVKTFNKEHRVGGLQRFVWDGTNDKGAKISTGMYFYKARFEQQTISRKMLILK